MTRSEPVILDVDTGGDDACALLLAALHPDVQLVAVTCVGGNASVDEVVVNTLKVLDIAGRVDCQLPAGLPTPCSRQPAMPGTSTARMVWPISAGHRLVVAPTRGLLCRCWQIR
jgi:inosine-uridine nucleoside N-ribohydrolase